MKQVNMLRYVSHSFKLSRLFYCKNLLKIFTNYIHAFSYALKNQFASLNNNEADAHCAPTTEGCNKNSAQGVATPCYSDFASNFEIISCNENYDFNHNKYFCRNGNNYLFSRNDYGKDFIFDFGNNFNYGFLFNRKINSKNLFQWNFRVRQ